MSAAGSKSVVASCASPCWYESVSALLEALEYMYFFGCVFLLFLGAHRASATTPQPLNLAVFEIGGAKTAFYRRKF